MDPAEELVGLWLQRQGFFVRYGIRVGWHTKEIDFLAINADASEKVHVEVHASVKPLGPFRAYGPVRYGRKPLRVRVRDYYNDKFVGPTDKKSRKLRNRKVEERVQKILGTDVYEKRLVVGVLHKQDKLSDLKREFLKHGVEVFTIEEVLGELRFGGVSKDHIGRFVQLLASQMTSGVRKGLIPK